MWLGSCLFYKSETHPSTHFTLSQPTLLPDPIRATELLHVFTEVTQSTVLCAHAGFTFSTHASWALNLRPNPKYSPQPVQRLTNNTFFSHGLPKGHCYESSLSIRMSHPWPTPSIRLEIRCVLLVIGPVCLRFFLSAFLRAELDLQGFIFT